MTSRSRRKPRTTAPRTWGPRTACSLALAALCGGVAAGQQPPPTGYRPAAVYGTPFPTTVGQPGGVPNGAPARPWAPYQSSAAQQQQQQQAQAQRPQPAPQPTATTGRPDTGPPAGYRAVSGGPQQPAPRAERVGTAGAGGQVMYFRKPADALAADGMGDTGAVAQVSAPPVLAPAVADVPVPVAVPNVPPPPLPAAIPDRPILAAPPIPVPLAVPAPVIQEQPAAPQPDPAPKAAPQPEPAPMAVQPKAKSEVQPLPPEVTQLPPRDKIFMMYDDAQLEKAIIEKARLDKKLGAGADLAFPPLPAVVPPGTQYVSRTGTLPPARAVYEPGFVVHRRLHFEERNAERYGWDLGFAGPFVSAAHFYRDVLLWPNSLASGAVVGFWDTSAGKCLPGSPVPYYLYPPGLTITGTATEALIITGASVAIP